MRFVLIALIVFFAAGDGRADTSLQDKIAYIIQTEKLKDQIVGLHEEIMLRSIEELATASAMELSEKDKNMMMEENAIVIGEVLDDYMNDIVSLYREQLTDQDISALYDFYRTPEGKSIASKLVEIKRKAFRIDARYIDLISERSELRIKERLFQEADK